MSVIGERLTSLDPLFIQKRKENQENNPVEMVLLENTYSETRPLIDTCY